MNIFKKFFGGGGGKQKVESRPQQQRDFVRVDLKPKQQGKDTVPLEQRSSKAIKDIPPGPFLEEVKDFSVVIEGLTVEVKENYNQAKEKFETAKNKVQEDLKNKNVSIDEIEKSFREMINAFDAF